MKRLTAIIPALVFLFIASCQKESDNSIPDLEISGKAPHPHPMNMICNNGNHKVQVCHNGHTLSINENAWPAHQAHGDLLGDCSDVEVRICGKTWMKKNLDVSTYRDGTPIPEIQDDYVWPTLHSGAWCNYQNNPDNGAQFGKLYNWFAINGDTDGDGIKNKELAPPGWHIPSEEEWQELNECIDGNASAIKSTFGWAENGNGTNSTGFNAMPVGIRIPGGPSLPVYAYLGYYTYFWTSTNTGEVIAKFFYLGYNFYQLGEEEARASAGFSVRCVKD